MAIHVPDTTSAEVNSGFLGAPVDLDPKTLEVGNRTVKDAESGITICDSLVWAWNKGIYNAARITAKINGERPWGKQQLKSKGKGYKRNISTRFLMQQCSKVSPRFYTPLKQASTLTAASLPDGWPDGPKKTDAYRRLTTDTIRAWNKWDYFIEGAAREITQFGLVYAAWFDKYDWRPKLIRMDKGFVPQGTELMDDNFPFFCVKWQYHPNELLELLKANTEAKRSEWKKDACVSAINKATPPPVGPTFDKWRDYEDLIRQSVWSIAYYKAMRLVDTYHLFARENTGKVSHYIYWRDGTKTGMDNSNQDSRLLYEYLDEYDSILEACQAIPFGYGDGSVQGAWGVGQLLFDMASQVEIARNEAMDAQSNQGKLKLTVDEGKNINDVKLTVNDDLMTVSGAQFASPGSATPTDPTGFKLLDDEFTMWAMQIVGNYVPPIPLQPSDTKAAAINAAQASEQEVQNNNLTNFLKHIALMISNMAKRLADKESPDEDAREYRKKLLDECHLTEEEIGILANQPAITTIAEFTPSVAAARAQFASTRLANPITAGLYNPRKLEEIQSQAVPGGAAVLEYAMVPEPDETVAVNAQHEQILENMSLMFGKDVPVLAQNNDIVHLQTLKQPMEEVATTDHIEAAQSTLRHAAGHYSAAVAKKSFQGNDANTWKQWMAQVDKVLMQSIQKRNQQQALAAQQQQMQAGGAPVLQPPPQTQEPQQPPQQIQPQPPAPEPQAPPPPPGPPEPKVSHTVKTKHDPVTGRMIESTTTQSRGG